jgi:transcriptional regulator with XRE-family HTH domain
VSVAAQFARNLLTHRKRLGLSQDELAMRASLHRTEVSQLEGGKRLARIDTLIKLAGSLGVTPAALLDGLSWEPGETRHGQFGISGEGEP